MPYPGWEDCLLRMDYTSNMEFGSHIVVSKIGCEFVQELLKLISASRNYEIRIFDTSEEQNITLWTSFFKKIIREVSNSNTITVLYISLFKSCYKEIWEDLKSFVDGGKTNRLWNDIEYEDLINKFLLNQKSETDKIDRTKSPIGAWKLCRHLSQNLKIVIVIDAEESVTLDKVGNRFHIKSEFTINFFQS